MSSRAPHWSQDCGNTDVPSAAGLDKYSSISHLEACKMLLYSSRVGGLGVLGKNKQNQTQNSLLVGKMKPVAWLEQAVYPLFLLWHPPP